MNILKKIVNYKKSKIITDKKNILLFSNQNKKSLFISKIVNNLKNNNISIIEEIKKAICKLSF
jgi:16S rRNA G527 N7-methylase RsmG